MKSLTIWLVIAGAVTVLVCCGGGGYFLSTKIYPGMVTTNAETTAFDDRELPLILNGWNQKELEAHQSIDMVQSAPHEVLTGWFKLFEKRLGKFNSVSPSKLVGLYEQTRNGESVVKADLKADASFEKGKGTVYLILIKRKAGWQIAGLKIDSPLLKDVAG